MNRLQKKCIIVTAGVHLLLLLILIVGPAFFSPKPPPDDLTVLDVIPANLTDAAFNSGVANAEPPPPPPLPVTPPPPVPVVTPPAPVTPKVEPPKPVIKDPEKSLAPPEKPKPSISTKLVTRTTPKAVPNAKAADDAARARAIRKALKNLKSNLTSATTVDVPGNSSVSYANYATAVKNIYDQAWLLPEGTYPEGAITKISVTIASDGAVISASIVTPSGDEKLDASVQRTLERVKFIAPFPEGATEKERTYPISFNPEIKRMLE